MDNLHKKSWNMFLFFAHLYPGLILSDSHIFKSLPWGWMLHFIEIIYSLSQSYEEGTIICTLQKLRYEKSSHLYKVIYIVIGESGISTHKAKTTKTILKNSLPHLILYLSSSVYLSI